MKGSKTFNLKSFLANLTTEPGIYKMLDPSSNVLYVGKATNLKNRVNSYFKGQSSGIKTQSLVNQIASIEVTVTRSENEALLLESSLIKSLRPKYNVLLRDDKSYPYIYLSKTNDFPRLEFVRYKKKPKKGEYFGPYPSAAAARETLNLIQKVFKIRNCNDNFFTGRSRPCLQFQIKRCSAPCVGYIDKNNYQQAVNNAIRFLQGKSQLIIDDLLKNMDQATKRLAFEEAASLRDQIKKLRLIQEQQAVIRVSGDADILAIEAHPGFACIQSVTIREGQIISSQSFFPQVPKQNPMVELDPDNLWQQVFNAFIAFWYFDNPERIPALIITNHKIVDHDNLEQTLSQLRGKPCKIQTKPRGTQTRWLEFAKNNLRLAIEEHRNSASLIQSRYLALIKLLNIDFTIKRMECFDISHTQGGETVASCVVFNETGPWKQQYRRFNISGITAGDDYAAMEQVLIRRFKRLKEEKDYPEILIIDGGKGQVGVAQKVLNNLGVEGVVLIGVAKGRDRKAGFEKIILDEGKQEITLPADSEALHLIQHIRDEAHRFAITAHRKKRQKSSFASSLENIAGIGSKRRQALLKRFGGLRELAKAPVDEIAKVQGISKELAEKIYEQFH